MLPPHFGRERSVPAAAPYDAAMRKTATTDPSANADLQLARLAGAIAEPARARMLGCLMDGHARTATELAAAAEVAASTASAHLARLRDERLVELWVQGRHRYFRLAGEQVAAALESLMVLAGAVPALPAAGFAPSTPSRLRAARTCYDHMAGTAGVALHDRLHAQGWLSGLASGAYELTAEGAIALESLGLDVDAVHPPPLCAIERPTPPFDELEPNPPRRTFSAMSVETTAVPPLSLVPTRAAPRPAP